MRAAGVTACVVVCDPGDDEPDHERALKIVRQNPNFRLAAGMHPHNARNWSDEMETTLRGLWALPECTVLGEIGLDYHYDLSPRDRQREVFERQLDLALEVDMPVQLHIREAHGEAMELMRRRHAAGTLPRGIMHCFSGSWELAKVYLSFGYYISLSGVGNVQKRQQGCWTWRKTRPSTACWWRRTAPTWPPCRCAASATSRRLCNTHSRAWPSCAGKTRKRWRSGCGRMRRGQIPEGCAPHQAPRRPHISVRAARFALFGVFAVVVRGLLVVEKIVVVVVIEVFLVGVGGGVKGVFLLLGIAARGMRR